MKKKEAIVRVRKKMVAILKRFRETQLEKLKGLDSEKGFGSGILWGFGFGRSWINIATSKLSSERLSSILKSQKDRVISHCFSHHSGVADSDELLRLKTNLIFN